MIRHADVLTLAQHEASLCISLYMPTDPANWRHDQTQFRSLLNDATSQAEQQGHAEPEIKKLIQAAERLLASPAFWQQHGSGVALFLAPGFVRSWSTEAEMPRVSYVNNQFHIAPLIPTVTHHPRFYVLALSQNSARLFHGNGGGLVMCDVPNLPDGMAAALWFKDGDKQSIRRSGGGTFNSANSDQRAPHADLREYALMVNKAVEAYLRRTSAPLMVAATQPTLSVYTEANDYHYLTERHINGNPDTLPVHELYALARDIVGDLDKAPADEARNIYAALRATDPSQVASESPQILKAARDGRVATLLVASGELTRAFGERIEHGEEARYRLSLLDDVAEQAVKETLVRGGKVYAIPNDQLPSVDAPLAAIMRY